MTIERTSVEFQILATLCAMPKPVRGISGAMLERQFGAPAAIDDLAARGLIEQRGWAHGPGSVWVPTAAGLALHREMTGQSST